VAVQVKQVKKEAPAAPKLRDQLQAAVDEAATRLHVPGVAVGVFHDGIEDHVFHGVTSVAHPLPVTDDTIFQIGSTGKTFTATAIMRLVENGAVSLDAPVRTYVPELRLRDERVAATVTVLQLLNHTAGWDGDFFEDQGDGDDALRKYVRRMRTLKQVFAPGSGTASYNNAAVALAGRVIEKVTRMTFERAIQELVLDPVGLEHSFYFANDIMTRSFAVGHSNRDEGGEHSVDVVRPWRMFRAANPMGGLSCTIGDTVAWARFHLGDGTGRDGRRVLSHDSLELMRTPTAKLPVALGDAVGISWLLKRVGPVQMVGHGGTTPGQLSDFQMVPERNFAVAINTNSSNGGQLHHEILAWVLRAYLDVEQPVDEPLALPAEQLEEYAGRFSNDSALYTIAVVGDHLEARSKPTKATLRLLQQMGQDPKEQPPLKFAILADDRFVVTEGPAKGLKGEYQRVSGVITGINLGGRLAVKRLPGDRAPAV
jgi:CubicO group peptidase (beta-lactamase class C family)